MVSADGGGVGEGVGGEGGAVWQGLRCIVGEGGGGVVGTAVVKDNGVRGFGGGGGGGAGRVTITFWGWGGGGGLMRWE